MEPVLRLKREASVAFSLCILCQTSSDEEPRPATAYGAERLREAVISRRKFRDSKNAEIIDRLDKVLDHADLTQIVWHRKCYAQFADRSKIKRLQTAMSKLTPTTSTESCSGAQNDPSPCNFRRSMHQAIDWTMCLFCRKSTPTEKIRSVETFNLSNQILENAPYDHQLRINLAGVTDLIATEGKYHLRCLTKFNRSVANTQKEIKHVDIALSWLSKELRYAAEKGHVIEMSEVWDRYCVLSETAGNEIPASFSSRKSSFREKLQSCLGDVVEFIPSLSHGPGECRTLVIPRKYKHIPLAEMVASDDSDEMLTMPAYRPEGDMLSLIHVALKIRGDISSHAGHTGLSVSEDDAIACIPDSLYMFLRLLFGGQTLLDQTNEDDTITNDDKKVQTKVLSIAQDIVFNISGGQKWTPKHIGLGCALHQQTRSKKLVNLFSNAGHIINYDQILQVDTALAESTLSNMNMVNGAVIPPNLQLGTFVHFTADNIDINDETLDGKNTFHATQVAAWQRGPNLVRILDNMVPSKQRQLVVPDVMKTLIATNAIVGKVEPKPGTVELEWFRKRQDEPVFVKKARWTDLAFILKRHKQDKKLGWTVFNQSLSLNEPEVTTVGYLPIIQAPAHEFDTLNTVVQRCMSISSHLHQHYTVITVDQALYCKLVELTWCHPEYKGKVIPRLGGLHISMNFLSVIGQHLKGAGLIEAWVEASLLGPISAEKAMAGKSYNKAMRAHKITYQVLWRILLPQFLGHIEKRDPKLHQQIINANNTDADELITIVQTEGFQTAMASFTSDPTTVNVNLQFWWHYIEMVNILLLFTRAQREGQWDLHLFSFTRMIPFFMRYDHFNYSRWGPIYIAEMHQLPLEIVRLFRQGDFVVKRSARKFNQVDPDQAQEWLNGTGKRGGGIIGITRTPSALARWNLSYNMRSQMSADTRAMFGIDEDRPVHNEETPSRQKDDNKVEDNLLSVLQRFNVLSPSDLQGVLINIATKDLATEEIQESLLNAADLGQEQLDTFVKERLIRVTEDTNKTHKSFHDPITKNKAPTFNNLFDVIKDNKTKDQQSVMKVDRNILQRLIASYVAGREVDLANVLKHELMPVPISLVETNRVLRTGSKAIISDCLTNDVECPASIQLHGTTCLIIDGQALVIAMGKPSECKTFGDLADAFVDRVKSASAKYDRVDIAFDRYRKHSVKASTRQRRAKTTRPIRRLIESRDVPLPVNWANFIALSENKADLAVFLSNELIRLAPGDKIVVAGGGFIDEQDVQSNKSLQAIGDLRATHEEADTRIILHAIHCDADTIVVRARDTDVLLLLIAHVEQIQCAEIWMEAGTSKKPKFIPIHKIQEKLLPGWIENLLSFHALSGCDTTSFIAGHSKKTMWKVFKDHHMLLSGLGKGDLTLEKIASAEKFFCQVYNVPNHVATTNQARCVLFSKANKPEALPPTSDALRFHIMRAHYQSMVWKQANCAQPKLPLSTDNGWKLADGRLVPIMMTLNPIPESCMEMLACQCKTGCKTLRCKCRKSQLYCTQTCKCMDCEDGVSCMNRRD